MDRMRFAHTLHIRVLDASQNKHALSPYPSGLYCVKETQNVHCDLGTQCLLVMHMSFRPPAVGDRIHSHDSAREISG